MTRVLMVYHDIDVADVPRFQDELREHLRSQGSLYADIREKKDLPDDLADRLRAELDTFKGMFGGSSTEG